MGSNREEDICGAIAEEISASALTTFDSFGTFLDKKGRGSCQRYKSLKTMLSNHQNFKTQLSNGEFCQVYYKNVSVKRVELFDAMCKCIQANQAPSEGSASEVTTAIVALAPNKPKSSRLGLYVLNESELRSTLYPLPLDVLQGKDAPHTEVDSSLQEFVVHDPLDA